MTLSQRRRFASLHLPTVPCRKGMAEMLLNLQELVSPDKEKSREEAAGDRATSHMAVLAITNPI